MSESDLIRRGDVRNAVIQSTGAMDAVSNINSLPPDDRMAKLVEALRELVQHTHDCEKELTEELHHADFCGESLPLTKARAAIAAWEAGKK
jgi:hypothetical protein